MEHLLILGPTAAKGCAGKIHLIKQFSGIIESPNYKGNSYPDLSYCQWKIEGLDGDVILISFLAPKCVEMSLVFYQIYLY